jgi:uncharacterized protein YeaO (DUF488 family)
MAWKRETKGDGIVSTGKRTGPTGRSWGLHGNEANPCIGTTTTPFPGGPCLGATGKTRQTSKVKSMPKKTDNIFTIGFTKKTASVFFEKLRDAGVKRIIDVRLNNVSQLAGFSKKDDLQFFLKEILGIEYVHLPLLAPTQEMLDRFKADKGPWENYERDFLALMAGRRVEDQIDRELIPGACLLCSEDKPDFCHRRLVAEYLSRKWGNLNIIHLV